MFDKNTKVQLDGFEAGFVEKMAQDGPGGMPWWHIALVGIPPTEMEKKAQAKMVKQAELSLMDYLQLGALGLGAGAAGGAGYSALNNYLSPKAKDEEMSEEYAEEEPNMYGAYDPNMYGAVDPNMYGYYDPNEYGY